MSAMPLVGRYALLLAFMGAIYVVGMGAYAGRRHWAAWQESVRASAVGITLSLTVAVCVLEYLLVTGDYRVQAVYNHSDRALPLLYKMGALWGGDSGSVLFWGWILSIYTGLVAWRGWPREGRMTPMVVPLLGGLLLFFSGLSNFVVDPFRVVAGSPTNGSGLDPLLQNLVMTIHPPAMYTGLIGMSVPAAYVLSAIWGRVPWREWIPVVRRWMLFSWMFLSVAIVLGGMWAYMELGWGGYWEWDPVENASLLPWLLATAFLHSVQLEEKRGMFRWWTAFLGVAAFLLTLVGTYITRSGVLKNSVHSFTGTGIGPYFVVLFWISVAVIGVIFYARRDMLRDRMAMDGTFSKEGVYVLLNVLFATVTGIVLIGTFYPVISKAFLHHTVILNVSFFNAMTAPLFLGLILLMGLAPVMGWRYARLRQVIARLRIPWGIGLSAALGAYLYGYRSAPSVLAMLVVAFAFSSMVQEYARATRLKHIANHLTWGHSLYAAMMSNRRRYGGYLAHIAFLVIVLGIIGSHNGNLSVRPTLRPGQVISVGGYQIHYTGLRQSVHPGYETTSAHLEVKQGDTVKQAAPGLSFFPGSAEPVAKIAILGGVMKDLYIVLEGSPGHGAAMLEVMVNPMVSWIWAGMYILAAGTLLAISAPEGRDAAPARAWEFSAGLADTTRLGERKEPI